MHNYRLFVSSGLSFSDSTEALNHIGMKMVSKGVVKNTYPAALLEREASFPTGIALEEHSIAIPHCEAMHALEPAIYLIRPTLPVAFLRSDDDGSVAAELIIALIVTDPREQLQLLKTLFGQLQKSEFIESLLTVPEDAIAQYFNNHILAPVA
ncbi:PTS galactitol transporter subunit IIA [Acerihabitans arboris]|uniref:PTS galactitol transporter subunit IIA n=1 Tax=Acerihabitans arboris TaxID=2691583 RepID=A0A845SHG0_9GAMM|nr:PTS galactitol transporter subunit IIA [Acerihabitans arboris]NDL64310.1 PTS galactitol transporter subunit IIA [Acerihabitans arboris]